MVFNRGWTLAIVGFAVVGLAALLPAPTAAQEKDESKVQVSFDTFDDARLVGTLYRGSKGNESPTAILIHRFGSDRSKGGWDALAKELQTKLNFTVLTFDLRGHGQSTLVKDSFWNWQHNKNNLKGGYNTKNKSSITVADFKSNYWPILFNDLVAARYYLDTENDAQRCNSSTIVVIAAQESAGLGMGWIENEYERRVIVGGASALVTGGSSRYPGEDIAAGVWLGPVTRSNNISFRPAEWFARPAASRLRDYTPMYFIYGKQDMASAQAVPAMFSAIKKPPEGKTNKMINLDRDEGLATSLPGQDLLTNATLGVNDKIIKWLGEEVLKKRKEQPWRQQSPGPMQMFPQVSFGYLAPS